MEFYDLTDVTFGSMQARYIAYNLYGARNDASICEVFFYLGSTEVRIDVKLVQHITA